MKAPKLLLITFFWLFLAGSTGAKTNLPSYLKNHEKEFSSDPRKANLEWFKSAKYGLFIHFGLYSLLEKEAWVQLRDTIPMAATYALIRKISPHALISFKQGANGDEDFSAPERDGNARAGSQIPIAAAIYQKNVNKPKEICNTLQPHAWAYQKSDDGLHKTAADILQMLQDAGKLNANLLLNIGPKGDGYIPEEDKISISEAGKIRNQPVK